MSPSDGSFRIGPWTIGAGAILGATMLAGRFSGLFREIQLAATFGVSAQADAAVLLLTLPDLLVNLLLSGGLSAALVPRLRSLPEGSAQILHRQTFLLVVLLFGVFAAILSIAPTVWFAVLAPGLSQQDLPPFAAVLSTAIAIPLAAASGVTTAGLNAQQKFLVAGCGTLIFNTAVIATLAIGHHGVNNMLLVLGMGIAVGSALRLLSQIIALPGNWRFGSTLGLAADKQFFKGFATAALSASMMLLVPVIVRALASMVSPGAISSFNYATKMVELPAGVLITSLATVALARLSQYHGQGEESAARQVLHAGVHRALTNAVGAGVLIAYFASSFIQLVLGRGLMDVNAISRVVELTQILMVGLPFLALSGMAIADLSAREKQGVVLKATLWSLILLPLFALPGLLSQSESLLTFSVIGFQVCHAMLLIKRSGRARGVWAKCFDRALVINLSVVVCILLVAILLDTALLLIVGANVIVRCTLASIAIGLVVVLPYRFQSRTQDIGSIE